MYVVTRKGQAEDASPQIANQADGLWCWGVDGEVILT